MVRASLDIPLLHRLASAATAAVVIRGFARLGLETIIHTCRRLLCVDNLRFIHFVVHLLARPHFEDNDDDEDDGDDDHQDDPDDEDG